MAKKYTLKIWFGCTTAQLLDYIDSYRGIHQHLVQNNCEILFDWLEDAVQRITQKPRGHRNIKRIYKDVIKAINVADACVIENTVSNFSVAHQITYSLSLKKPTLVLWQKKDNQSFTDSYLEALESKYLIIKQYSDNQYKSILDSFLHLTRMGVGQKRYNVVLGNKQRHYLDWASVKYKKSRSAIIRQLIDKASRGDDNYGNSYDC